MSRASKSPTSKVAAKRYMERLELVGLCCGAVALGGSRPRAVRAAVLVAILARAAAMLIPTPPRKVSHHRAANKEKDVGDRRREIPQRAYTEPHHGSKLQPLSVTPIGWVECPYKERFGTPRQATVSSVVVGGEEQDGYIQLAKNAGFQDSLRDLAGFDYCWVIAHMHLNTGWRPLVQPPRGPT